MALSDIFGGGLLGGGSDPYDIYGDLFSEKQREALRARQMGEGLLRMAGAFGEAAQPSRLPTSFGAALGKAAGALAGSGDEGAKTALAGMKVSEDVRASRQKREWTAKILPMLARLAQIEQQQGLPPGTLTSQIPGAAAGAPAAPGAAIPGGGDLGPFTGTPGTTGDFPGATGALPLAGAPAVNASGMPAVPDVKLQQNSGLLPDQVVGPDGQPLSGPGVLPAMMASLTGGAPGGPLPFRLASSTPTGGVPREATGADNNFGGLRRPGVIAPPSRGGFQQFDTPEAGVEAISRQLDRYASGATTGKPLNTVRSIVSTWAPPNENDTPTLIKRATEVLGVGPDTPLDMANPNVKARLIEATIRNEKGGALPVDPQMIRAAAIPPPRGATPPWASDPAGRGLRLPGVDPAAQQAALDTFSAEAFGGAPQPTRGGRDMVIPSGRGIPRSALTNVADTGGAAPGDGKIPGLNMTPQQLGALGAMTEIIGLDNPFKAILDTYYKSPGYLESSAAATEKGKDPYVRGQARYSSDLTLGREMITRGIVLNPDGSLSVRPGAESLSAAENAKFTNDIKEYNFYAQQVKERGGIPDPFDTWDRARKKAGATTINTAEGFDAAQTKARVGVDAKIAQDVAEQAITGRRLLPVLDELSYLADKTPEGWRGTLAPTVGRTLAALGVPVPLATSNAEAFQALAQRLVPIVREPGATSQGEMALYLQAGPALSGTVPGRRMIIDINRAMIERSQEIAKVYRANIGAPDLYDKLAALDKPLFTDEQRAEMQRNLGQAPAATAPPGAAPVPSGAIQTPYGTVRPIAPTVPGTIVPIPPRP